MSHQKQLNFIFKLKFFLTPHTAPNGGAAQAAENKLSREEENELFAALNISSQGKFHKIS